jgi:hypothetical protein
VTGRRLAAVPDPDAALFDPDPRTGRVRAALARSLRELRSQSAIEPVDAVRIATLRTLVETYDRDSRRRDVSTFAMANAARTITDLFNALSAGAAMSTSFDDLVAALGTDDPDGPAPTGDGS